MRDANKVYASPWSRVLAFVLDDLLISAYLVGLVAVALAMNVAFPGTLPKMFGGHISAQAAAFLSVTLPVTFYFAVTEASQRRASWGKRRLGLQVVSPGGHRLTLARSLGRTALKFIPWELSHTLIWQIRFSDSAPSAAVGLGFVRVWGLVGANLVRMWVTKDHQAFYDWLAGTYVVKRDQGEKRPS